MRSAQQQFREHACTRRQSMSGFRPRDWLRFQAEGGQMMLLDHLADRFAFDLLG